MSEGPISQERAAWKPPEVSTKNASRVCMTASGHRAYCGRKNSTLTSAWPAVSCADCRAAGKADGTPGADVVRDTPEHRNM